jgi:hypothetical protein
MLRHTTAVVALVMAAQGATAGSLKSFDLPSHGAICGAAIADDGAVVGNTTDLTNPVVNFVYQGGSFTLLSPVVPAGLVDVTGINRSHTITGFDAVISNNFVISNTAFTLIGDSTSVLSILGAPSVTAAGINNAGVLVGSYQATAGSGPTLGFVKRGNHVTTLDDGSGDVLPAGIDPAGTHVVGSSLRDGTFSGWLYSGGQFVPINFPGAIGTLVHGINRVGTISGTYFTGTASALVSHGLLDQNGVLTSYDVPGASSTELTGINMHDEVTGCYTDTAGTHGLIYKP